ncbi:MAG TPA: hypothetical protein VKV77_09200 [Methylovirgula sp.]|nr:hypothetical protein [Methylovirgula sp.]
MEFEPRQRSLLHLVRWFGMICAVGILLACATAAVALLSEDNPLPSKAKAAKQAEVKSNPGAGDLIVANAGNSLLVTPAAASPLRPVEDVAAPLPIIEAAQRSDRADARKKIPQDPASGMPTLALDQVIPAKPHQASPFNLSLNADGVVPDHSLIAIRGLPKGTVLSAGHSDGADGWYLVPDDLGNGLSITPGEEAKGTSELVVQLLAPDGRVANEKRASLVLPTSDASAAHEMTPEEIQVLMQHGRDLERVGYFAGARLFFQRAADAGSAEAARAMGETYDPVEFEKLGVRGLVPDEAMAQKWYERAQELEAKQAKQGGATE